MDVRVTRRAADRPTRSRVRLLPALLILANAVALGRAAGGTPVRQEQALRVEVTPLIVERGMTRAIEPFTIEATRDEPGFVESSIPWSPSGPPMSLSLEIGVGVGGGEDEHALRLAASARIPGSPPVRSSRELRLSEGTTGLFDVVSEGERRLVLSLRVETVSRTVVRGARKVGAAVLFLLSVERRDGDRSVPLETNRLVTFLREGVEYSFSRGEGNARESLRLVLTPVRLEGDLAEIEVDVSGSLPASAGPLLLSRRERIFASRGATSTVEVTAGEPPAGYRFRITPDF
jgi:hypothetical protein